MEAVLGPATIEVDQLICEDLPMTITATARLRGDSLTDEVEVNGRHTIVTDEPERLGGADLGPARHELLAATLASSVLTMVAGYAESHGWRLGDTSVSVIYDPKREPRKVTVETHLPEHLSRERRSRLERVARTCPVRRALEGGFDFDERFVSGRELRGPEQRAA